MAVRRKLNILHAEIMLIGNDKPNGSKLCFVTLVIWSHLGIALILQLCKLLFLRLMHLCLGRRYVTIIVFAVIRVIGAIFLRDTLDAAHNDAEHLVAERCLASLGLNDGVFKM